MKRCLFILPALLYMALIFVLSSRPAPELFQGWPLFLGMKVLHLVEYGVLAALWIWGLRHGTDWPPRHVVVAAAVLTFLWGVSDETHQSFVPGRTARVTDAIADLVAALAVVTAWYRYRNTDRSPDAIRRRK